MMRWLGGAALVGVGALLAVRFQSGASRQPDVVLILADTLRRDALGVYGARAEASPAIDAYAAQGVTFSDCTAQCSWTRPSMVSLLQGVYLPQYRDRPLPERRLIAEELGASGYRTIGSVANPLVGAELGFARGFDVFHMSTDPPPVPGEVPLGGSWHMAWDAVEQSISQAGAQPVFLYLHLMEPHAPYEWTPRLADTLPAVPFEPTVQLARALERSGIQQSVDGASLERITADRAAYAHDVRRLDEGVNAIVERFKELRPDRDVAFLIASDHGEALYDCLAPQRPPEGAPLDQVLYRDHGQILAEPLIRTPLVLFGDRIPRGVRVEGPVENVDVFPTLLHLAGAEVPPGLSGRSLLPLVPGMEGRRFAFSSVLHERSVRDLETNLKLILPTSIGLAAGRAPFLSDWSADPGGFEALDSSDPQGRQALEAELRQWARRHAVETSLPLVNSAALEALGYAGPEGQPLESVRKPAGGD